MILLIALAFAVVLLLVMQLRAEFRELQEVPVDSLHWNVTQLEVDSVRLETEVLVALSAPDSSLDALRNRFDLFYSRAMTVIEGGMFSRLGLAETVAPLKAGMRTFLSENAPLIDGSDDNLRAGLPRMATGIENLSRDLRATAIRVIDVHAALQDARRARLSDVLQKIALAGAVLFALLLALLVLVLTLNRQADRRTREVQRITSRLEATVGTSLDAVIVAGMDGRVIDFNAAAETIFGYTRVEAIGQSLGSLIVPQRHKAAHEAGMERMKATGVRHVVDAGRIKISAVRKSGEEFPIELSIASNDGPDGMIFIAYLRDISDAQEAEAALVAARDEAQAAEQTKSSFIAVMSHEMRTPLNGVIGALEILERTPLKAGQERFLTLARNSAQQLLRHVNDVLDIARVEAGHLGDQQDSVDFPSLIATLVDPLRPVAARKSLPIDVRILSDFPRLRGDAFRIGQVIQNFVSNAIKFTDVGAITVEAELHDITGGQANVEVRVIDTGLGIADADQDRIFEDFVMVDPSYGRSVGGTGLGLAISRRLSRAMGGEVGVESTRGEGSCFWLRLPLDVDRSAEAGSASGPAQGVNEVRPSIPIANHRPLEVLVVEDNETNRIVLDEMLRHLGHRVTLAADGGEGVEKARTTRFDVVLMDLSMPMLDGWTSASIIRMGGASQHSRILAVTAHARPDRMDRMAESGIDGWLTKPLSVRALTEALAATPDASASGPAPQAAHPLVDAERVHDLCQIADPAGLQRLLTKFRAEIDQLLTTLDLKSETALMQELAAVCHAGVGSAAVMGASRLHHRLAALEACCVAEDRPGLQAGRDDLRFLCDSTLDALNAALQKERSSH